MSDLLDPVTREWDLTAIRLHLLYYEEHIGRIIPASFHIHDELTWLQMKFRLAWKGAQDIIVLKLTHWSTLNKLILIIFFLDPLLLQMLHGMEDPSEICGMGWHFQDPQDIKSLPFSSNCCFVTSALVGEALAFMPRVKNAVADSLAKSALFELQNFHDLEE
ncbi:hypothetical protein HID58_027104 [Brassica napus]|uniref:Uncharacterized protein n=1 Tax=Brassica napus TaxID=3708 RepID=A0ABQ8CQZ9_BRANA|nr:hypothetical protein HID58_027104 [Brassica napus]